MSNLMLKIVKNALWQPVEPSRQGTGDKTHMAPLTREFNLHTGRDLVDSGERLCRQEGVILGIEQTLAAGCRVARVCSMPFANSRRHRQNRAAVP